MLAAREEAGITQSRLSELSGIAQPDISRIEKGRANPSVRTLKRLAAGLGKRLVIDFV
ncbi:MAG: helix-turn-helix transcriptional regulator [Coriobacteriales bacterium]|nr:helix-turn-helix transcriptional regulator [Coriobacteriales bacterium]